MVTAELEPTDGLQAPRSARPPAARQVTPRRRRLVIPMQRVRAAWRADWRFLLPKGEHRRIAIVLAAGTEPDYELVTALRDGAADVRTMLSGPRAAETHDRDLIVLSHLDTSSIRCAAGAADAGCILYAELRDRSWMPFRTPRAIKARLRRNGFEPLAVHWHRPDHEHCEEVVPLGNPRAVIAALRRRSRDRIAALSSAIGILLVHLHLFDRVASPLSVTARWIDRS